MKKIALHSVPRSGSTWLGEIFNSNAAVKYCFQPLFSYRFKDFLNSNSTSEVIDSLFELLRSTNDDFVCQSKERSEGYLPKFVKQKIISHVVYKEVRYHNLVEHLISVSQDIKFIFLIRDPIEVMNSWVNSPKEFNPNWSIHDELCDARLKNSDREENFFGLNNWIYTTHLFERLGRKFPNQVAIVKYAELNSSPIEVTKSLFYFSGLEYSKSTDDFIAETRQRMVEGAYSVFRGAQKTPLRINSDLIDLIIQKVSDADLGHHLVVR
jgi:hypothetical protein